MSTFTSEKISLELENAYKKIDNYFIHSLWLNNGIAIGLMFIYQNWWISLLGISFLNTATLTAFYFAKNRTLKSYSLAILFCLWSALFMLQTNGILEIRYIYFVYVFIVSLYQNPSLLIVCFFISFLFTLGFFLPAMQEEENNLKQLAAYFLEPQNATLERLGITIFAEILVCSAGFLYATLLKKQTYEALERKIEIELNQQQIEKDIAVAKEIANGNFSVQVEVTENDVLSQALEEMRRNLLIAAEKEQQDKFINVGIAEISHTLRIQYKDTTDLCKALISQLVKYLKANQGAIFILHETKEESYLKLEACYAYDKNRFVPNQKIKQGEGLVGQVMLEKMPIYLSNIPSDYVRITSGLGEATPRYLILMPLLNNERLAGVIEIASFSPIAPHEQDFLQKAAESIAITINNTQITEKTKQLLQETQAQTEQMQAQEEEMRQNLEELMATQEEMERKSNEIRGWFDSLNNSHIAFFVLSTEGNLEQINRSFLQMLGMREEDIIQKSIKKLCWNESECHKLERLMQDIMQENAKNYNTIITFKSKEGKAIHLDCSLIPIQNHQGDLVGIRVFATNITNIKENEQRINDLLKASNKKNLEINQLREKTEKLLTEMQGKLDALDTAGIGIIEFKVNSAILSVNKMLQDLLEYPEEILYKKKLKDLLESSFNETEKGKNLWTEIRSQKSKQENLILITSSKKKLEANIQFCTVYDSEGLPLKIVGVIKNIKRL